MRPGVRIPLWSAPILVAAAYGYRSLVVRRGDWQADATDLLVLGGFSIFLFGVSAFRRQASGPGVHDTAEKHISDGKKAPTAEERNDRSDGQVDDVE